MVLCLDYENYTVACFDLQSYKLGFLDTITLHTKRPGESLQKGNVSDIDTILYGSPFRTYQKNNFEFVITNFRIRYNEFNL